MKWNFDKINKFILFHQRKHNSLPPVFFIYCLFNLFNSVEFFIILHNLGFNLSLKVLFSLLLPPLTNYLWAAEVNFYNAIFSKYNWYENSLFILTQSFILLYLIMTIFWREYL